MVEGRGLWVEGVMKLCKNKRKNNLLSNVEQSLMCYITAQVKYTHFQIKGCNILSFKNIYAIYKSK